MNVPTGGKKKKLKTRVAAMEDSAASKNPQVLAMTKTSMRYAKPTVVALTGITRNATNVTAATAVKHVSSRKMR